jgi:hypothetical protein
MNEVYEKAKQFKNKYPLTIAWRLKKHSNIVKLHLNPDEEIKYVFTCQKNDNPIDIITTYVIALTNKRIILGHKRLLFGYFFTSITPDMFNDLKVEMGLIWGKIIIDTVKEEVFLSNIEKSALSEIETNVTQYMMEEKKKYVESK